MNNNRKFLAIFLIVLLVSACSKVPISGRKQMKLLPESMMMSLSLDNYKQFLGENKVISSGTNAEMVKRTGNNLAAAIESYFGRAKSKKLRKLIQDYKWEFNLVDSKEVNAWCMPGGKVVVYDGLLPVTQNETALAVVMGHEIAHAIAQHGNERMSQGLLTQLGGISLAISMQNKPQQTRDIFLQSYGVGTTLGLLAYGRKQESEADRIGLIAMAMAGYDPKEAIPFWQRMAKVGGPKPPQILSTHPSDETRIKDIKAYLTTAMRYYNKNANKNNKPSSIGHTPVNTGSGSSSTNKDKANNPPANSNKPADKNTTGKNTGNKQPSTGAKPTAPSKPK